jgi:predicted RNase H-like HicB family nuclease
MATDEIIPNKLVLNTRSFGVVISRTEENDGYIANIPSLNTCFAFGDTIE